jgi:hypothetical protein
MSGFITLHKEKGVNPHLGMCPRCGGDNGEILLLGAHDRKVKCRGCGTVNYGASTTQRCGRCNASLRDCDPETIEESERVPSGLCGKCKDLDKQTAEVVAAGGVFFRCKRCGSAGAVRADHPMSAQVRCKHGPEYAEPGADGAYKPCGVEFASCPVCEKEG